MQKLNQLLRDDKYDKHQSKYEGLLFDSFNHKDCWKLEFQFLLKIAVEAMAIYL